MKHTFVKYFFLLGLFFLKNVAFSNTQTVDSEKRNVACHHIHFFELSKQAGLDLSTPSFVKSTLPQKNNYEFVEECEEETEEKHSDDVLIFFNGFIQPVSFNQSGALLFADLAQSHCFYSTPESGKPQELFILFQVFRI